ncbi:MoeZ/MoeB domain containing protein [Trichomonas vaginalis G3]|uniref:MoeZ/MoeB domain containing protein n=1 Tax=Trichomonas vaginalis (strain ATCC PRA-98 / G3) TaxID=412133 RepID=A2E5G6_TRIV3|nr:thiosulfate sulfurtransferase protein [Trichomonas vaginalis G3]EAY12127.1 MoeZ/MoeB domain containing protein [Trichomonas vaginalis G3]KAI5542386.1 thiosulfate sulfurtransferase protein [Trichomonas vaginalis G3]|eukprot:XP_001324350.1 MoeZ/MoeB domain containing protein [Trichomonas vaginalis G3]
MDPVDELYNRQLKVYTREGQEKLAAATVLMIGCGGLGSTVSLVLSRSGVGHLVIVDKDTVAMSNIHRQILYNREDVGKLKVEAAAANPLLQLSKVTPINTHIDEAAASKLIEEYKPIVVMDCTDNFDVRIAVNAACAKHSVPFVYGSITGLNGQVSVFCYHEKDPNCPCFNCIHPEKPTPLEGPPPVVPGICTITGTFQAQQAIAIITGVGHILVKELFTIDIDRLKFRTFRMRDRNPDCPVCGKHK